jgi:hypothetical protein
VNEDEMKMLRAGNDIIEMIVNDFRKPAIADKSRTLDICWLRWYGCKYWELVGAVALRFHRRRVCRH